MKVAIIGAGVSGLSCAHELEKSGIRAVIYERNSFIGEQMPHVASFLAITHRPIKNQLKYLHQRFDIDIKPLNTINTLIHHSPNKTSTIKGNLGYFVERGKGPNDLKNQIFATLKNTEIRLNESVHFNALENQFDYIMIGAGDPAMTDELGCFEEWFQGYERGAIVLGDFDVNTQIMWINKDYCKHGYAFLAPFNNKRAFMTVVASSANKKEVEHYWEEFLSAENIQYDIVEEFKLQHLAGNVYPHQTENKYFIGNAGGAIDSFLGFGQVNSIVMGVMAARAIVQGVDYETLIADIVKRNKQFYEFRKAFNSIDNKDYDKIIASIGLPGIKQVLYKLPTNIIKYGSKILRKIEK
ncbi:MAG: NAD(P)-binding protein [Hyphomonadaceae bacterium]|nr:NAD(P)-binding protein [Clostridia bacterium]